MDSTFVFKTVAVFLCISLIPLKSLKWSLPIVRGFCTKLNMTDSYWGMWLSWSYHQPIYDFHQGSIWPFQSDLWFLRRPGRLGMIAMKIHEVSFFTSRTSQRCVDFWSLITMLLIWGASNSPKQCVWKSQDMNGWPLIGDHIVRTKSMTLSHTEGVSPKRKSSLKCDYLHPPSTKKKVPTSPLAVKVQDAQSIDWLVINDNHHHDQGNRQQGIQVPAAKQGNSWQLCICLLKWIQQYIPDQWWSFLWDIS